jgi:hypothetical protein
MFVFGPDALRGKSWGGDHAILNLVVLGLSDHVALHQVVCVIERAVGDDTVCVAIGDAGQIEKVFTRRFVDVHRSVFAHAFLHPIHDGLGVLTHGFSGFGSAAPNFVGIIGFVGARDESANRKKRGG